MLVSDSPLLKTQTQSICGKQNMDAVFFFPKWCHVD